MVDVRTADLRGKLSDIGRVRFLRAEWWKEAPRFVLLRFAIGDEEQDLGLRLDIDKKAILDRLEDDELDRMISDRAAEIWQVVTVEKDRAMKSRHHSV